MRKWKAGLVLLITLALGLMGAMTASADDSGGITNLYSVVACRDSATVVADVYSPYSSNELRVRVYFQNDDGEYQVLSQERSSTFGKGYSRVMVTVLYTDRVVDAYTPLMLDVQLKRGSGDYWEDLGAAAVTYTGAADKLCAGACTVVVDTSDVAPADGTITLRSRYGDWFRPEGSLFGALSVTAGSAVKLTFPGVSCDWTVRAWYYPKTGADLTPKMLPSQYWPGEYQATTLGASNPYVTSFAAGLPATKPLEEDDPFVVQ